MGIFDSGVGGLSVARELRDLLPRERLLYIADSKYVPYGNKPPEFIIERSRCLGRHLLARGAKAVIQLYPETPQHMELITSCAMRAGFTGGLVVDFPNSTKAKKYFLCLCAGNAELNYQTPAAQGAGVRDEDVDVDEDGNAIVKPGAGIRFEMGRSSPRCAVMGGGVGAGE